MKTKTSLIATALTLALFGSANADTYIVDINGSTAGRAGVHNAVYALLSTAPYTGISGAYVTGTGITGLSDAKYGLYKATYNAGADTLIVRTSFLGSAEGVRVVADAPQLAAAYMNPSVSTAALPAVTSSGQSQASGTLIGASAETVTELGFSDVFQTSTIYQTNIFGDIGGEEVNVGIIPFKYFRNRGATKPTNITSIAAKALWTGNGAMKLSVFTGDPADATSTVYATGRNASSGSRITFQAEMGIGVFKSTSQYTGVLTGTNTAITAAGNGGHSSGIDVANTLSGVNTTFAGQPIISYLGASDWDTAVAGSATECTYNGVPYSVAAVQNGSYTFWGYLHMFKGDLSAKPEAEAFYDALKAKMLADPGISVGLLKDDTAMKVKRSSDGGRVFPK